MKKITILGSTGSIGVQALEVIEKLNFEVLALSCGHNIDLFLKQINKFKPKMVVVQEKDDVNKVKSEFPNIDVLFGDKGLFELSSNQNCDLFLVATSGKVGMLPTLNAINNGINIALANKETLVMAGDIVMKKAKEKNVKILPIDSEHSAIFQSASDFSLVSKLIITASGGPFLNKTIDDMENANVNEALNHPRWSMGKKITIDSATLMNKGLEVIEAHHLFNFDYDDIKIVIHPESIIHSAVEFKDGSVVAQMGLPSMHLPIQYAITYPDRLEGIKTNSFNFIGKKLTFFDVDFEKFKCLKLALEAGKIGGSMPALLSLADEYAVNLFLCGEIKLTEIQKIVENAMNKHEVIKNPTIDDIINLELKL